MTYKRSPKSLNGHKKEKKPSKKLKNLISPPVLKRLPASVKNFGVTELELELELEVLVNIHGFMQLLHNCYFEVLVDHKAIEYLVKSKMETPTTRLKTLLLKLSKYTIDLKYQKGSEMQTSDALCRLHNLTDTPDNKDVILLNFYNTLHLTV